MTETLQSLALAGLGIFIAVNALAGQSLDFMAGHWCQYSDSGSEHKENKSPLP